MKMAFLVYRETFEERISAILQEAGVDFFTEWENVKGKGHKTMPHMGTRVYPGYNNVRMIAFEDECQLDCVADLVKEMNTQIRIKDDLTRMFQVPLERII